MRGRVGLGVCIYMCMFFFLKKKERPPDMLGYVCRSIELITHHELVTSQARALCASGAALADIGHQLTYFLRSWVQRWQDLVTSRPVCWNEEECKVEKIITENPT